MSQKEKVVRTMFQMELTAHIEASGTNRGACRSLSLDLKFGSPSLQSEVIPERNPTLVSGRHCCL